MGCVLGPDQWGHDIWQNRLRVVIKTFPHDYKKPGSFGCLTRDAWFLGIKMSADLQYGHGYRNQGPGECNFIQTKNHMRACPLLKLPCIDLFC